MIILLLILIALIFIAWIAERNIFREIIEEQQKTIWDYEELILKLEGEK